MSFLVIKDGKVEVTEEGMTLPPVIDLYNNDKHTTKKFFNDTATYTFYSYKNGGVYANKLPEARKKFTIDNHLSGRDVKDFERNTRAKTFIELYKELEYTPKEQLYQSLMKDFEEMQKRLSNIPYEKEVKVSFDAEVTIDGEKTVRTITQMVMMDNTVEKEKAIKLASILFDHEDKLKDKILIEKKDIKKSGTRLFDQS